MSSNMSYLVYTTGWLPSSSFCRSHFISAVVHAQFEILRQFKRRSRTSVFAQAAEHAAGNIEYICRQRLFSLRIALPADFDAMFRACQSAQIARDTQRLTGFGIIVQARRP